MSEGLSTPESQPEFPFKIDSKTLAELTPNDLQKLSQFIDQAVEDYIKARGTSQEEDLGVAAYVHAQANSALSDAREQKKEAILDLATDLEDKVRGYSLVTIDADKTDPYSKVTSDFIGVDPNFQSKGLGTKIMKTRLEHLRKMGISGFRSYSRQNVERIYDRLGVKYDSEPVPEKSSFAKGTRKLTIHLS